MEFTADEMKQLRYRLGYSQAEMARCLNLQLAAISGFESGREQVPADLKSKVVVIFNQAEDNAERVHRRPIAEVKMRELGLCQIPNSEIES